MAPVVEACVDLSRAGLKVPGAACHNVGLVWDLLSMFLDQEFEQLALLEPA